ncbi:MAG TPA: hypothetical protein ENH22_00745 [Candidatus Campbellbacteria bacterium]|nr:hypothetical protein [Candidatus Campbellbacteria bacterium]
MKAPKKFILLGLDLLDLEALTYLDEIMQNPNEDFFYLQKRKQSVVIGLTAENIDTAPGGDIVFQDVGETKYRVWENTAKGKKLIKKYKRFFEESDINAGADSDGAPQIPNNESLGEWSRSMRELLLDSEFLAKAVEWSRDHPIWDELGKKCLGCGICTYVCPLCHCFSIEDSVGLDDKCSRCRKWDACTLPDFAKIAGGHNFRPSIKERYYDWFYHKFVRGYNEYGKSQCVGCERCKELCPAGIDIYEILSVILKDYKKTLAES